MKFIKATIFLVLFFATFAMAGSASAEINHVQSAGDKNDASGANLSKAFSTNVTAGNLIVVTAFCGTGQTISSVSDSLGNNYVQAVSGASDRFKIYYAKNINGGANTVTVNFSASVLYRAMSIHEYSGADKNSPFDVGAASASSRAGVASTDGNYSDNINTTLNGSLIVAATVDVPADWFGISPGTGLTERYDDADWYETEDKIQMIAGSTNATWTPPNTDSYYWMIAAFKPAVPPVEFVSIIDPDNGAGTDYTSLSAWEAAVNTDLTASSTKVFSGTKTGAIADNTTVYLCRGGSYQTLTANARHVASSSQILVQSISANFSFAVGDIWYTNSTCNSASYFTNSDTGNSAIAVASCRSTGGTADTATAIISGWNTSVANYIKIWTDPSTGARHNGKYDGTKYRLEISTAGYNYFIDIEEANVRIDGLQGKRTAAVSANGQGGIVIYDAGLNSDIRISNNILQGYPTAINLSYRGIEVYDATATEESGTLTAWNNIVYDFQTSASDSTDTGIFNGGDSATQDFTIYAYNNTVYNCGTGYYAQTIRGPIIAKNNISYNNTDNYYGTFSAVSTNNLSGPTQTDAPGSNPQNAKTLSFVSTSTYDFHLLSSDTAALGVGVNLSADPVLSFADDIDGEARSNAPGLTVTDNFNRSTLDGNWTQQPGDGGTVTIDSATNLRIAAATSADAYAYWSASDFNNDQYSQAKLVFASSSDDFGVTVRASSSQYTLYRFIWNPRDAWWMDKYVNGTLTRIASTTAGPAQDGDVIKLTAIGSTITGYVNGVQKLQVTDTSIVNGYPGAYAGDTNTYLDDWQGGDIFLQNWDIGADEVVIESVTTGNQILSPNNLGLVGYWPMDEGTGAIAGDFSGNGNDGTASGSPAWVDGKRGKALSFDGTSDYVDLGNDSSLELQYPMTISAWINLAELPSAAGHNFSVVARDGVPATGGTRQFEFRVETDDALYLVVYPDGVSAGQEYLAATGNQFTSSDLNQWIHIAVTVDASRNGYYYKNGTAGNSDAITNGTIPDASAVSTTIGEGLYGNYNFEGKIDEVRIYNRTLSADEVQKLYERSKLISKLRTPNKLGLVGYWSMDEGLGAVVGDFSGNRNDGTIFSVVATDNFNRTNGALGANWTTITGSNALAIVSNQVKGSTAVQSNRMRRTESFSNDQFAKLTIINKANAVGALIQAQNGATNVTAYRIQVDDGIQTNRIWLKRTIDGTDEWTETYDTTISSGDVLEIRKIGSLIQGYYNGQLVLSHTDSSLLTGGTPGIYIHGTNSIGDNFESGDITGTWVDGKRGKALSFNGTGDYISSSHAGMDQNVGTVSMWFKPDFAYNDGLNHYFFDSDTARHAFYKPNNGNTYIYVDGRQTEFRPEFSAGQWHMITFVWNKTGSVQKLYLDGAEQVATSSQTGTWGSNSIGSNIYIGNRYNQTEFFDGVIDETRLYNRALSATEVASLYGSSKMIATINSSQNTRMTNGLVGLWSFNGPDVQKNSDAQPENQIGSNLLSNGDFWGNITGWEDDGGGSTISWQNAVSPNGTTGYLRFTIGENTNWDRFRETAGALSANTVYAVSLWYRTSVGITGNLKVSATDDFWGLSNSVNANADLTPSTSWKFVTLTLTTNALAYPYFFINKSGDIGSAGDTFDIDGISIRVKGGGSNSNLSAGGVAIDRSSPGNNGVFGSIASPIASDNFNRTTLGANWSQQTGNAGTIVTGSGLYAVSSSSSDNFAYWDADTFNDDQYSQVTLPLNGLSSDGDETIGVTVRASASQETFYTAWWDNAVNAWLIIKAVNGSWTGLVSTFDGPAQAGDVMRLTTVGNAITLYVNGKLKLRTIDSSITSGYPGIYSGDSGNRLDDWEGGNAMFSNPVPTIGKVGQAFKFDGVDDYISIPDNSALEGFTAMSVCGWGKLSAYNPMDASAMITKSTGAFGAATPDPWELYFLSVNKAGKTKFCFSDGTAGTELCLESKATFSLNNWHHICGVYNGSVASTYLDGVKDLITATSSMTIGTSSIDLRIGGYGGEDPYSDMWNGAIDEVRVYNRALSDDEVKSLYRGVVSINRPASTLRLYPQADTYINVNYDINATSTELNLHTWPSYKVANAILMKFDLSGLPSNAIISDAKLNIYLRAWDSNSNYPTYNVTLHKIINFNPDLDLATGYTYDGTNGWTANTACYNNIPLAQADISSAYDSMVMDKVEGYKIFNAKGLIQDWLATPATNYGLLFNADGSTASTGGEAHRYFDSTEATSTPYLDVTYSVGQ